MDDEAAYKQKIQSQLNEWNAEIDKLKAKADSASADAQLEYNKQIRDIQDRQETVEHKLNDLEEAGEGAWEEIKTGLNEAMDALGDSVKSASARLTKPKA